MEKLAEVIQGFLAMRLLANDGVGPQPVQHIFIVIIERSPP